MNIKKLALLAIGILAMIPLIALGVIILVLIFTEEDEEFSLGTMESAADHNSDK